MAQKIKKYLLKKMLSVYDKFISYSEKEKLKELKSKLKKVGKGFSIGKDYSFLNAHYMEFGDHFSAMSRVRIEAWDSFKGEVFSPSLKIGNNVIFNTDIHIGCINSVIIGDNCLLASHIFITDHHHGDTSLSNLSLSPSNRPLESKGGVKIEENVWIGEGVVIMPGVTIGKNSIIGANAVVTRSIPENSVAAGIPAIVITNIK